MNIQNMNMKKAQQGFTLIELMIVVAIIGILASIAIPAYQDYIARAKFSEVLTLGTSDKTRISEYYQIEGAWPATSGALAEFTAAGDSAYLTTVALTASTGVVTYTLAGIKATDVDGKTVVLTPTDNGGNISWACVSTAAAKWVPKGCTGA